MLGVSCLVCVCVLSIVCVHVWMYDTCQHLPKNSVTLVNACPKILQHPLTPALAGVRLPALAEEWVAGGMLEQARGFSPKAWVQRKLA